jgi:hypothetical protein
MSSEASASAAERLRPDLAEARGASGAGAVLVVPGVLGVLRLRGARAGFGLGCAGFGLGCSGSFGASGSRGVLAGFAAGGRGFFAISISK